MSIYSGLLLDSAPVAYYRLGEAAGATTLVDSSGNGRDGAFDGTRTLGQPGLLVGDADTAVRFSGGGGAETTVGPWPTTAITVTAWFKPALLSGYRAIAHHQSWSIYQSGSYLYVDFNTSDGYFSLVKGGLTTGVQFVAFVYDGSMARLFYNGVEVPSTYESVTGALAASDVLQIGRWDTYYRYDGWIDEVAVHDRALTASEVSNLYAAGTGQLRNGSIGGVLDYAGEAAGETPPWVLSPYELWAFGNGPMAYYRFGEPAGSTTFRDSSGNGHHGQYVGDLTLGEPGLIAGDDDTSMLIANWGSAVVPPQSWMATSRITVAVWINPTRAQATIAERFDRDLGDMSWTFYLYYGQLTAEVATTSGNAFAASDYYVVPYDGSAPSLVAFTYDGTTLRIYHNGVEVGTSAVVGDMVDVPTASLKVGGDYYQLQGSMDELAIYGQALTASDIGNLYAAGTGGSLPVAGFVSEAVEFKSGRLSGSSTGNWVREELGFPGAAFGFQRAKGQPTGGGFDAIAEGYGIAPAVPTLALTLVDEVVEQAPTTLTATLTGGVADTEVQFAIDGTQVRTAATDSGGGLAAITIPVPETVLAGSHTLTATQTGAVSGSATFTVQLAPAAPEPAPVPDVAPVVVPSAGVRWVLQDPAPGGLGSYVLPANPESMTSPHPQRQVIGVHTAAGEGQFHLYESGPAPVEWQFSGYCPTQEMYDQLLAYGDLRRRFYVIDHRNRVWAVTFLNVELVPRLRQVGLAGVPTDWGHDYTVRALVYNGVEWS